jgi:hypothetical protein
MLHVDGRMVERRSPSPGRPGPSFGPEAPIVPQFGRGLIPR